VDVEIEVLKESVASGGVVEAVAEDVETEVMAVAEGAVTRRRAPGSLSPSSDVL